MPAPGAHAKPLPSGLIPVGILTLKHPPAAAEKVGLLRCTESPDPRPGKRQKRIDPPKSPHSEAGFRAACRATAGKPRRGPARRQRKIPQAMASEPTRGTAPEARGWRSLRARPDRTGRHPDSVPPARRSEEHTSELQSPM